MFGSGKKDDEEEQKKKAKAAMSMLFRFISPEKLNEKIRERKPKIVQFFHKTIKDLTKGKEAESGLYDPEAYREASLIVPGFNDEGEPTLYAFMVEVDQGLNIVRENGYYDLGKEFDAFDFVQFIRDETTTTGQKKLGS